MRQFVLYKTPIPGYLSQQHMIPPEMICAFYFYFISKIHVLCKF